MCCVVSAVESMLLIDVSKWLMESSKANVLHEPKLWLSCVRPVMHNMEADNSFDCNDMGGGSGAGRFFRSIGVARLLCDGLLVALCCNEDDFESVAAAPVGAAGARPFLWRCVVDANDVTDPCIELFLNDIETLLQWANKFICIIFVLCIFRINNLQHFSWCRHRCSLRWNWWTVAIFIFSITTKWICR